MDLSIFLAKLIGLYLLITAVELLLRRKEFEGAVKDFASSKGLLVFSGSISLLLGLGIAIGHPVYEIDWTGLITLIGYVMIARGVVRSLFPSHIQKKISQTFHESYVAIFLILAVVGVYLTYMGFTNA